MCWRKNTQQLTHNSLDPHTEHTHGAADITQVCVPPVLPLLGLGLLVASRHLGLVARLSGWADLDGSVLKRGGRDGHFGAALRDDRRRITGVYYFNSCQLLLAGVETFYDSYFVSNIMKSVFFRMDLH